VGVGAIGGALVGLGIAAQVTAFGLAGLAAALSFSIGVIGAILSPLGLLLTAVVALATYLIYSSDVGVQALTWLGQRFAILKDDALQSWNAIGSALASGDIALAGRILWLTLKMEWQRGVNYLTALWLKFKKSFVDIASQATFGVAQMFTDAAAGIEVGWIESLAFLSDSWSLFVNMLTQTWNTTIGFIRKAWVRLRSLFDEELDVEAEVQRIDQATTAKNNASQQSMLESIGQRDKDRQQRRSDIERDRAGAQSILDDMQSTDQTSRDKQFQQDLAATESEVQAAREAWQAAIAQAQSPDESSDSSDATNPKLSLPEVESSLAASRTVLDDQQRKVESKGGFNALGLSGLGADSLSQRTAKATEQVAVNTKALVDQAKRGRLVFTD
jgi:hypothetical protein